MGPHSYQIAWVLILVSTVVSDLGMTSWSLWFPVPKAGIIMKSIVS